MLNGRLLFLVTIIFLFGCETKESVSTKAYLDIDSLINDQIENLVSDKAKISKSASLGEVKDQSEFTPDSIGWATELDIFRQLSVINKPTHKDSYQISDGEKDVNSNLTVRSYEPKKDLPDKEREDLQVQSLTFYYYQDFKNLRKIEAVYKEKNALYFTERNMTLSFDELKGKSILSHYSINGVQKMTLSDTVHFTVNCDILF